MKSWDEKCNNECESVRVCEQIREMCSWRDRCVMFCLTKMIVAQLLNLYVHVKIEKH